MTDPVTRPSFRLDEKPWLLAQKLDGSLHELSLRQAFAQADQYRTVVGELPTQTFALTRLLLAILYRAIPGIMSADAEEAENAWQELWEQDLPLSLIEDYLDDHAERFDLLDPRTPFFQVADLRTSKDEHKGVEVLIADVPANNRLFTTRLGSGLDELSFAEAARWVVHAQAFDISGIKSGAVGDERVKGSKGYPIGTGWSGMLGGILLEGRNLKETLLLNLVPSGRSFSEDWSGDRVPWEQEPHSAAAERDSVDPKGPADLYTWQSRRIRLVFDTTKVSGALITNGDKIMPQNKHKYEMMTTLRRSNPQEKALKISPVYMPRTHDPKRQFWRGLSALLPSKSGRQLGGDPAPSLVPGTIQWLATLQNLETLPNDQLITMHAIGIEYGPQSSVFSEIVDDKLLIALSLLRTESTTLAVRAEDAITTSEQGVIALRNLAGNLASAAGGPTDGPRDRAAEAAYAALDDPYRRWLRQHCLAQDAESSYRLWLAEARQVIWDLGRELIEQAGPVAWSGREVRNLNRTDHINTNVAELWFLRKLTEVFGPYQPVAPEEEQIA